MFDEKNELIRIQLQHDLGPVLRVYEDGGGVLCKEILELMVSNFETNENIDDLQL